MTTLSLYLVSQNKNKNYDTYDSFVIACEDKDVARHTNPDNGAAMTEEDWASHFSTWCSSPRHVKVTYLGTADPSVKRGIVCKSFNAG